ncbi:hypothetical protein OQJ13_09355 [Legionella sp. PATHC035]|uniref:hypothetical protein n=1 Tax=Legionella sp. PATHC035 TaxID=2992040 RepID=UPI002244DAC0|nr:hypothetical protein [Legionella sp. PATHC035]MCW8409178.1 hypothetical protein [Legionella sp. PATHC035]
MKAIIELTSMNDKEGTSTISAVQRRVNQLLDFNDGGFKLGESTSRDSADGALTDLRTLPLPTLDPKTSEIRRRLTLLQLKYNLIHFEEKVNEGRQSTFIITKVAYPEFLNVTQGNFQFPTENMRFPEVNSVIIRSGLHDIRCHYIQVQKGTQIFYPIHDLQILEEPDHQEPVNRVVNCVRSNHGDDFSIMDYVASQGQKDFYEIKSMLNKFCDLDTNDGFSLYFQSSSPEFPIDLRIFLDKEDTKGKNALLRLSGFVQFGGRLIYEVKSTEDSNQIAIIIKAVNKAHLEKYFTNKGQVHLEGQQLGQALTLIKEHFPNDKHIRDLVVVSGEGSYSRPFPHIRTSKFWSLSQIAPDTIRVLALLDELDCIDFDVRPENRFTVEKRNNAQYIQASKVPVNFQNDNFQLIVVPKNLSLLQEKLQTMVSNFSFEN